jgi:hypothetical protein
MASKIEQSPKVTNKQIEKIFVKKINIKPKSISKINIGFSSYIYNIDNKYIFKIRKDISEICFEKGYFLLDFFKNKLPCPKKLVFDNSNKIIPYDYGIHKMIEGDNLFAVWQTYTDKEREQIIKQICIFLKIFISTKYNKSFNNFNLDKNTNWKKHIENKFRSKIEIVKEKKLLSKSEVTKLTNFLNKNIDLLDENRIVLIHSDLHFDNFLVKNKKIVGVLDFDSVSYKSIDYPLHIIKRMEVEPKAYFSETREKYIRLKDYKKIRGWYKKYFPEMFAFKKINTRVDIYLLERRLKFLILYPRSKNCYKQLIRILNKY